MSKDQISSKSVISVEVTDNPDLNFNFDTTTGQSNIDQIEDPACKLIVNQATFQKLLDGTSTFEKRKVQNGILKVEGNNQLLRSFGSAMRSKATDA